LWKGQQPQQPLQPQQQIEHEFMLMEPGREQEIEIKLEEEGVEK
jgi:hypothetical protein